MIDDVGNILMQRERNVWIIFPHNGMREGMSAQTPLTTFLRKKG